MNEDEILENEEEDGEDMVPVKDEGYFLSSDYAPNFHHDRLIVGKLSRADLEDRYLVIVEDNFHLKKGNKDQEDKIKKLATKLIRVLSDKKRIEMGSRAGLVTSPSSGRLRDPETENYIEDQNQRIRELEKENAGLRDKFQVAKTQLLSLSPNLAHMNTSRHKRNPQSARSSNNYMMYSMPAVSPVLMASPQMNGGGSHLNQQAHRLLEEARNENRMLEETICTLKERISIFEQELDLQKEQAKIKESHLEDEIGHLKSEMSEGQRDKVNENIEVMKLQREIKSGASALKGYHAQVQALESEMEGLKSSAEKSSREARDMSLQLQEEQRKITSLTEDLSELSLLRQSIKESDDKVTDLKKENVILREHNERLLNSAFDLERERQYQAKENALKLNIAQLETAMKNDLSDKKALSDALEKEREGYVKLEGEFEELRGKYHKLKELSEEVNKSSQEDAKQPSEPPFDPKELEEAILYLRQKKDQIMMNYPSFMTDIDTKKDFNISELKKELSELQVQFVDTLNELDKTRELLRIQNNINIEQKKEIESLHKRTSGVKVEYLNQISEFKKLLEMRSNRISKLENQIREAAYSSLRSSRVRSSLSPAGAFSRGGEETSLHTPSGQSLFEIHVSKVSLIPNAVEALGERSLPIFATWLFQDYDMQYSPVIEGPEATLDCSSYYKVKLSDDFLEFLREGHIDVQVHLALQGNESCLTIGSARITLSQVLEYPSNKLHGSVMVYSSSGARETSNILGTLDFWFKLHTAATHRIQQWLEHRQEIERNMKISESNVRKSLQREAVDLYSGESAELLNGASSVYLRSRAPKPLPSEPQPAPRVMRRKSLLPEGKVTPNPYPRKIEPESPKQSSPPPAKRNEPANPSEYTSSSSEHLISSNESSPHRVPPLRNERSKEKESDKESEHQAAHLIEPSSSKGPIQVQCKNETSESSSASNNTNCESSHEVVEEEESFVEDEEEEIEEEEESSTESEEESEYSESSHADEDERVEEAIDESVRKEEEEDKKASSQDLASPEQQEEEPKQKKKRNLLASLFGRKKFKQESVEESKSKDSKKSSKEGTSDREPLPDDDETSESDEEDGKKEKK